MFSKIEIGDLIASKGSDQQRLFENAREARDRNGRILYLRAVVELSSYCRQDCFYCPMRRSNYDLERYRLDADHIVSASEKAGDLGMRTIVLESGEDHTIVDMVADSTKRLKQNKYRVELRLGDLSKDDYRKLRDAGADAYVLSFETSNSELFATIRPGTTLKERLENLKFLRNLGFEIGTGNVVGLPRQTTESLIDDILLASCLDPNMISASPFIPPGNTPFETSPRGYCHLLWT